MSFTTDMPNIFPDYVTARNMVLFIISKEYSHQLSHHEIESIDDDLSSEEAKFFFYQFLFKSVKDDSVDIFNVLMDPNNVLKKQLTSLVIEKISRLVNDLPELLAYTHTLEIVNGVLSGVHDRVDVIDSSRPGDVCKYSVMGVFMKKFALAFSSMSMEKIEYFWVGFVKVIAHHGIVEDEPHRSGSGRPLAEKNLRLKMDRLCEDQVLSSLENIYRNVENTIFEPNADRECLRDLRPTLDKYKNMYPHLSHACFLDHMLTIKNKSLKTFERDIQDKFAVKYLSREEAGGPGDAKAASKDSKKTQQAVSLFGCHKKMSEINLNSAATLFAMGFSEPAIDHYKNALFSAKLSKNSDLIDDVKNVGNSMLPASHSQNPTAISKNSDSLTDKTALGHLRVAILHHLHSAHSSLAGLLQAYFSSAAPLRREATPLCLVFLSVAFRAFGFESMANTYLQVAACLEGLRRTRNHEQVLVELAVQMVGVYVGRGRPEKVQSLVAALKSLGGGGAGLDRDRRVQTALVAATVSQALARLDLVAARQAVARLRALSSAEWALRRVQLLLAEEDLLGASRLAAGIAGLADSARGGVAKTPPGEAGGLCLEDVTSAAWGPRDWGIFECRLHWLMCSQMVRRNHRQTASSHLARLEALSRRHRLYQFGRLCEAVTAALSDSPLRGSVAGPPSTETTSVAVLGLRQGLSHRRCQDHDDDDDDRSHSDQLAVLAALATRRRDRPAQARLLLLQSEYAAKHGQSEAAASARRDLASIVDGPFAGFLSLDVLSAPL